MREAASYTESMGADSANTLLYPPNDSYPNGHSFTDLIQPRAGSVRALVVTAKHSVEDWLTTHQDDQKLLEELVVVSVGDGVRSTAAVHPGTTTASTPDPLPGEPIIEFVSDAGNLTELGQTINAHLSDAPTNTNEQPQTILYLDSISALLEGSDVETVFRFLHTLTSLVNARNATAYYQLDTSHVDPETVSILSALFEPDLED